MKCLLFLSLALVACSPAAGQVPDARPEFGDVAWRRGWDESLAAASRDKKPVLVLFQEVPG